MESEDIDQWAERENLTPETLRILKEEGFDSLEKLSELSSADIDAYFTNTSVLKKQQCTRLKKAVEKMNTESSQVQADSGHVASSTAIIRFVLVGKTGVGKSSTGNTILGTNKFVPSKGFSSETSKCEIHRGTVLGENVEVVDTPGLYDTSVTEDTYVNVIAQAVACMYPGPDVFLFLVKIGERFTPEATGAYQRLVAIFDESVTKHMIVVFTGGDELSADTTISDILDKAPPDLRNILKACENRHIVFNNKSEDRRQVKCLLDVACHLMRKNDNRCYRCPKYFFVEKTMKKEIQKRMAIVEKIESKRNMHLKQLEENIKIQEEKDRALFEKIEQERARDRNQRESVIHKKICELKSQEDLQQSKDERDKEIARLMQEMQALAEEGVKKRTEELEAMKERKLKMSKELQDLKERMMWDEMNRLRELIAENEEKGLIQKLAEDFGRMWNLVRSFLKKNIEMPRT